MTDETSKTTGPEMGSHAGDSFAWTEPEHDAPSGEAGTRAREWMTQLQSMIEQLATQAAPVVREVGAKAAELAALAGDKAGPVAARAAELTGQAGHKLAVRSRDFAAELRRDAAAAKAGDAAATAGSSDSSMAEEPTPSGVA